MAAGGAFIVVLVACLVTALLPAGVPLAGNVEATSRTAPRLVDLVVAVASGFVGALAAARDDVGETLPGVAVAVSIVPPLCVAEPRSCRALAGRAGRCCCSSSTSSPFQLAGNLAFFLMGFGRRDRAGAVARRLWYATAIAGTLLVALPLAATSERIAQGASDERAANAAVRQWLDGSGYESLSVKTADDGVTVEIAGAGPAPSAEDLAALLRDGGVEVGEGARHRGARGARGDRLSR